MFIKLHRAEDNEPIYLNVDHIDHFEVETGEDFTAIETNETMVEAKETLEAIIGLIEVEEERAQDTLQNIIELAIVNQR